MEKFISFWEQLFDIKNTHSSSENVKSDSVVEQNHKLKFRIKHYSKEYYTIEYSTGGNWEYIKYWIDMGFTSDYEKYDFRIFKYEQAERFISNMNTIDDVNEYHKSELAKRDNFYRRKKEHFSENVPYEERIIIKG